MTTYEQLEQEGRLEGEQKGKMETSVAILARQLARRLRVDSQSFVPLLSGLDLVQYEELSEKVMEAESLDEIHEWLKTARHN